ncbi:MAG: peptidoglycan DD-metalloendopeptidase family protein [Cloacibacillus sp.]
MRNKAEPNKINKRKTICLVLFLSAAVSGAVIFAAMAAERTGMYWIGQDNEFVTERPEDNRGFFTVDVSDFLSAGPGPAEAALEEKEIVPLAIGPLPSIPTLTEEELKLYGILSKNDGLISSTDQSTLDEDIHWTEVVLEPGDTLKSIADDFGVSAEDLRRANGLQKGETPNQSEVLYVPDTPGDVPATLLFVRKLQREELLLAKKGKLLEVSMYTVKAGDTLWAISDKYDLDVDTLVGSNKEALAKDINHLKLGMKLRIPNQDGIFIRAAKRDTIDKLADRYGATKESVMTANSLKSDRLVAGTELFLPGGKLVAVTDVRITTKTRNGTRSRTVSISRATVRGFGWPVFGQISSSFGWRRSPFGRRRVFHSGLDIRAPRGSIIRAAAGGVVVHSGWMGGYGKAIVISHSNGMTTLYGHCSKLVARRGATVTRGQTVALVGSTGRSTGNHVHFEVRVSGAPRNPLKHLR